MAYGGRRGTAIAPGEQGLVSVVIPSYQHAKFIVDAIESVRRQSYTNWEIIVVDNHSQDGTEAVVRPYISAKLSFHSIDNHGVVAASRNLGISKSHGSFIAFLDSDDIWHEKKLELQMRQFQIDPDLSLVCSNAYYFPRRHGLSRKVVRGKRSGPIALAALATENSVVNSSVMVRKKICDLVGPLSEDPRLRASEDYEYWLRVLEARDRSIYFLAAPLVGYRLHASNILSSSATFASADAVRAEQERIKLILEMRAHRLTVSQHKAALLAWMKRHEVAILTRGHYAGKMDIRTVLARKDISLPIRLSVVMKGGVRRLTRRRKLA